jgi:hypothetical protein
MLKNIEFFIVCVNHYEEHYGGWEPSLSLKLEFFLLHVVDIKLVTATNHSILRIKKKLKMY